MNAYVAALLSLGCLLLTAVVAFFNAVFGSSGIGIDFTVALLLAVSIAYALAALRGTGIGAVLGGLMLAAGITLGCFLSVVWVLGHWHRYDIERWCAAHGVLPVVQPVKARGILFTPNRCQSDFSHKLCTAAENPGISAPQLLARGFEFVEYDGERTHWRSESKEKFVRLRLVNRPDERCDWIDRSINRDVELAIDLLDRKGVQRAQCIAAEFGGLTQAEYQFAMKTTKEPKGRQRIFHQASLIEASTSKVVTEVGTVSQGGTDKRGGLSCRNYREFEKLLDLVIPLR